MWLISSYNYGYSINMYQPVTIPGVVLQGAHQVSECSCQARAVLSCGFLMVWGAQYGYIYIYIVWVYIYIHNMDVKNMDNYIIWIHNHHF